jgi:hypothetical protein
MPFGTLLLPREAVAQTLGYGPVVRVKLSRAVPIVEAWSRLLNSASWSRVRVRTAGRLMMVAGGLLVVAAVYLWQLGVGACDTSCGDSDRALAVLGLPGLCLLVVGVVLVTVLSRREL